MTKKYLQIEECVGHISMDGTCIDLIEKLKGTISQYGVSAEIREEWAGYDGGVDLTLYYFRQETDQERDKRLEKERKEKEKKKTAEETKKEKEYKQYLKLKKKFEKE